LKQVLLFFTSAQQIIALFALYTILQHHAQRENAINSTTNSSKINSLKSKPNFVAGVNLYLKEAE